ncbi:MAG: regulatory protein RecX [Lachnospiraceae bacterium]|nr:regulatory protein RecX [Lachnospiraceae bacterium]
METGESRDEIIKRTRLKAMKLLEQRDYTQARLRLKLKDAGFPDEAVNDAVEYVSSYGYVDDLRYACNLIRTSSGKRSRREIERKLMERGVSSEIIREAFESEAENIDESAEDELIKKVLLKRCPHPGELDNKQRTKLLGYMYNKGFQLDRVERILEELLDITY